MLLKCLTNTKLFASMENLKCPIYYKNVQLKVG